jgi:hypothetical protein
MALVNIDVKEAMDEAAAKLVPALQPVLQAFADKLVEDLKQLLVGRKITITIE